MQRKLTYLMVSEDEEVKEAGLTLDLDEIARKGVMSKEEKTIAKWYGIYGSRQPGNHMARIVTPGGMMTSAQARNIARISEKYGQGVVSVTTRAAIQFHWLKLGNLADMVRGLAEEGSTTRHGCGDVTRQIPACPMAETCSYRRFDVRPYAQKAQKMLGDSADLDNLPRKFKITFSGCEGGCAQPYINCLGFIAVQRSVPVDPNDTGVGAACRTENGFRVIAGGGMGWDPYVGQELFSFIPADRAMDICRAVALTFRDHGDRFNRATARLKVVVAKEGIDKVREYVFGYLVAEGKSTEGLESKTTYEEIGIKVPDRPLADMEPLGTDGKAIVRVLIPKGELSHAQLRRLAQLSEIYGNQRVYTNQRQNIELHGIEPAKVNEVQEEIRKIGLGVGGFFGLRDMVACVGSTYCPKAVTETRALFDALSPVVNQEKYRPIDRRVLINITGCPNSCAPYRITDIGFRGLRVREEIGSVEGYEVLIGGDQKDFGKKLGEFKLSDCPQIVETVLDHFVKIRGEDESLTACVNRVGVDEFIKVVYA